MDGRRGELYKGRSYQGARPCRAYQAMAGVGLALMGRRRMVLSRRLTDYDYNQLFLVTSFLPATHVHSGLCESDLRGCLNLSVTCPPCLP